MRYDRYHQFVDLGAAIQNVGAAHEVAVGGECTAKKLSARALMERIDGVGNSAV